jgi:hypothetical protein
MTVEAPQPRREPPLWTSFGRLRIFIYPERPNLEVPPRRSRFGVGQPELARIHVISETEIHADFSGGSSYSKATVTGRYWLPQTLVTSTVFCWLIWPAESVNDAIFALDIVRWIQEGPPNPPDQT